MEENEVLKNGFELKGRENRYIIEGVLGQGAFGITYIAKGWLKVTGSLGDDIVEAPVAIKEFFIGSMNMGRDASGFVQQTTKGGLAWRYAERFKTEALNLAKLQHENIVRVIDFIEANGTYYYAMRFVEGDSLDDFLKKKGPLSETEALQYIQQSGAALMYMHAEHVLHLDLKPKNIMRRRDGHIYLIDFGLSKQFSDDGQPENNTSIGLGTNGYAPIEQSTGKNTNEFQPTLDVYALGATLYKLLTGKTPPDASDVMNDGLPKEWLVKAGVSEHVQKAIEHAMQPRRGERTQSIEQFLKELGLLNTATPHTTKPQKVEDDEGATIVKKVDDEEDSSATLPKQEKKSQPFSRMWLYAGAGVLLSALAIWGIVSLTNGDEKKHHEENTVEVKNDSINSEEEPNTTTIKLEEETKSLQKNSQEKNEPNSTSPKEETTASNENQALQQEIEKMRQALAGVEINSETETQFYDYLMAVKKGLAKGLTISGYKDIALNLSSHYAINLDVMKEIGDNISPDILREMEQRKKNIDALTR